MIDLMFIAFRLNTSRMRLIPLVNCQGFIAIVTRMAVKFDGVPETLDEYTLGVDYEHVHRDAEHEHEEMPEYRMVCLHGLSAVCHTLRPSI